MDKKFRICPGGDLVPQVVVVGKLDDRDNTHIRDLTQKIDDWFNYNFSTKVTSLSTDIIADKFPPGCLYIALGGDGTMVKAMHLAAEGNGYAMGVNLGRLGFLTEFDADTIEPTLYELFVLGEIRIEHRSMLSLYVNNQRVAKAVNEFSFSDTYSDTLVEYDLFVNDWKAGHHRANGLIVSSPTGSTAYALSAGGAIMAPHIRAIQIVPVAPMTLTSRPIVIGMNDVVKLDFYVHPYRNDSLTIKADGVFASKFENGGFGIKVVRDDVPVRMIHSPSWGFFETLKEKLDWNRSGF